MLATLVAVALLETLLVTEFASGGQLLLCIYPSLQIQAITCSSDGTSLVSIDSILATRLGEDVTTCAKERSRNAPVISQCTYALNNTAFYYQFQYRRCNLQQSCLINRDFPSAIVILGSDACTADGAGNERNAVIINWSCVVRADYKPFTIDVNATSDDATTPKNDIPSSAVIGAIVGSTVSVGVALVTVATLLVLARKGRLRSWAALAVKLHCCYRGSGSSDGGESSGSSSRRSQKQHQRDAIALQPTVLVIDKHGNLASAPQESLRRNDRESSKKAPAQRKTSKKEADGLAASDLEVEVDTSDDYQEQLSCDLSDACEDKVVPTAAESEIPDKFDDGSCLPPKAVGEQLSAAEEKTPTPLDGRCQATSVLPTLSDGGNSAASQGGGDTADKAESRKPTERGDKKTSRRRKYEIKWNARYGDTTETETDDRRPPPLPPPYVLDPDPNTYQIPWLPSPPDSSDEC